jgi:hypothetical protein
MIMTRQLSWVLPITAALLCGGFFEVRAATPLPAWYGESDTTRQGYLFTTSSMSPTADILENPYQPPQATVTLGGFADGWQDPANPLELSGVLADGAWDLGMGGTITVSCQVAANPPEAGMFYRVDFEVYAVAYDGITALPVLGTAGLLPKGLVLTQTTVAADPMFPGATWEGLQWTGYFEDLTIDTLAFTLEAPADNTSVVDTLEVFTKVTIVPEPSVAALLVVPALGWVLRRRRI